MKYKIVVDNTCELTDKIKACGFVEVVKTSEEKEADEKSSKYLKVILNNLQFEKKSCPAPEVFKAAYECDADVVFVVTMSRKLCGAFSSAAIGRSLYFEEHGEDKIIKVINSNAVCQGEAEVAEKIIEGVENGCSYNEICKRVEVLKKEKNSGFVTETLEYIKAFGTIGMVNGFSIS